MALTAMTNQPIAGDSASEDRREWLRIDDNLLLEYRLLDESTEMSAPVSEPVTDEVIAAAVGKPTAELLAHSGEALTDSSLVPWMMKVDWLLEVLLKTVAKAHPGCMDIARVTAVNISGGGVSFTSSREFKAGDRLALKIILPPFTPIQTIVKVIRSVPDPQGQGVALATEFVDLNADDQEHLIRHILRTQAERLRARRGQGGPSC
ncbi:MAG: PilZ domain-containing protein [Nitrospira sp.]|nr:PilZ domain-containing protein [Nitrospira sp.]MBH0181824.1 PilZ domain-containing protein [Nitrospira sp.]MBH0186376.1 PilZ domain-containing protein [Nitrospira sp.]